MSGTNSLGLPSHCGPQQIVFITPIEDAQLEDMLEDAHVRLLVIALRRKEVYA